VRTVIFPVLHGVHSAALQDRFAEELIAGVAGFLTEQERRAFLPLPFNWSSRTKERQLRAFAAVERGLPQNKLRRLKHTLGSDVVWYNRTKTDESGFFATMHRDLDARLATALELHPGSPVVIFGHSLGSQIAFNYCWETALESVSGVFFAGSPFTMYSGMFSDWGRLPPKLRNGFLVNFFNRRDFISSPIQGVHPSGEIAAFVTDCEVPRKWNPWDAITLEAHSVYWRSRVVWKTVASYLKPLMAGSGPNAVPASVEARPESTGRDGSSAVRAKAGG
jgi:pimeloyl-ACP methyl ester carboxylesterase